MCGILAHMPCGDDDIAEIDVEDVSHGRTPRHACRLRTPAPATPPILSPCFGFNTRQQKALRSRVAEAQNCKQTAPGIAVAGLPPSMNRGQKKTRITASARAGYRCLGV